VPVNIIIDIFSCKFFVQGKNTLGKVVIDNY